MIKFIRKILGLCKHNWKVYISRTGKVSKIKETIWECKNCNKIKINTTI